MFSQQHVFQLKIDKLFLFIFDSTCKCHYFFIGIFCLSYFKYHFDYLKVAKISIAKNKIRYLLSFVGIISRYY